MRPEPDTTTVESESLAAPADRDAVCTLTRAQLAALLAHHADVIAARWRAAASGPGAWQTAAARSIVAHADELTAAEETPAVAELLDAAMEFPGAPALRGCVFPGCLARYDARAAVTGERPARPEWSAGGWRTVGCGSVLPAGGHLCPEHGGLVAAHLPRAHTQRDPIAVGADCSCGRYVTGLYRWHGAAAALWQDHLLREAEAQQAQEDACTPAGAPNSRNGSTGTGETERGSETHSHARTNHEEAPPCPN